MASSRSKSEKKKLPPYVLIRDGQWFVRRAFPSPQLDAKNRRIYVQVVRKCVPGTEWRARELAEDIVAAYNDHLIEREQPVTVAKFFDDFLAAKRDSVEVRTIEYYEGLYNQYVAGTTLASMPLADLRLMDKQQPTDIQTFYRELREKGASKSAVRRVHRFLSLSFNQAIRWNLVAANPVRGAITPKPPGAEISFFDEAEAKRFIEATYTSHNYTILHLALETGMRPQEYLALSRSSVDLVKCEIHVSRAVSEGLKGGGYRMKEPKTKKGRRTIRISEKLRDRLRDQVLLVDAIRHETGVRHKAPLVLEHIKAKGANYEKRRLRRRTAADKLRLMDELDLLFPSASGGPMSRLNLNRRELAEVLKLAKIKPNGHSLYSLRHTMITLALRHGADLKAVSERAGHEDVTTTLRTYAHVLPSQVDDTAARIEDALY